MTGLVSHIEAHQDGCLTITVTENKTKLWSVTYSKENLMDRGNMNQVFDHWKENYQNLKSKKERSKFIDEILKNIYPKIGIEPPHRKSLIRSFNQLNDVSIVIPINKVKVGRKPTYQAQELKALEDLWVMNNFACGKRLKPSLPAWLKFYSCADSVSQKLLKISAATIDRLLINSRVKFQRENTNSTIPQKAHIRKRIKLREQGQIVDRPGYSETDTVVHCGDYIWGTFGNSITHTDLLSGWTEARMVLGKNAELVVTKLKEIELILPYTLLALYFDNGIEYINHLLADQFSKNHLGEPMEIARGRVGRSNDQCHIEQKNNTYIRKILGYERIEKKEIVDAINDLYTNEWSELHNHFHCQLKLKEKDRIGSKTFRKFDEAKTPYQRLMDSEFLSQEQKHKLKTKHDSLNPIELHGQVQKKLAAIYKLMKSTEKVMEAA